MRVCVQLFGATVFGWLPTSALDGTYLQCTNRHVRPYTADMLCALHDCNEQQYVCGQSVHNPSFSKTMLTMESVLPDYLTELSLL